MGRFEVQNFRGHEGGMRGHEGGMRGKYLSLFAGGRKSSIVGGHFDAILIPQALHRQVKCCTCS